MGGEMMYILEQRLNAQKVTSEKALKILGDSIKTMFSQEFVDQLFEPQRIFSLHYAKQIFIKIVHSSIMTLNETSMSKVKAAKIICFPRRGAYMNNQRFLKKI